MGLSKLYVISVVKEKIEKLDGINVSLLGFGTLRFPTKDGMIDEELADEMIDYAYKSGVNYFDTAWNYHEGKSEPFTANALKNILEILFT